MNLFLYTLLRLCLLVALALTPVAPPLTSANAAQPPDLPACQPAIFPGRIIGTVSDSNGQPLEGVAVTAHPTTGMTVAYGTTNAAGIYAITLLPGTYLLEFRAAQGAFQRGWYSRASSPLAATAVEVGDGKTVSGLDMQLPAGAQFYVTLRDTAGTPVQAGQIAVFDRYGQKVASGQTDDTGHTLTVPGLAPGSYRLQALPTDGSLLLPQYANQKPTLEAANRFTVTQALSIAVALTLPRGAQLSGTVTSAANGAPLAGIGVHVRDADAIARDTTTNAQGRYSIVGLPSGTYQIEFRPGQGQATAPLRRVVTLSAPNAQPGVDAALARGGSISGRVLTIGGAPIADAAVRVRDTNGMIDASVSTSTAGTYLISGLPSGHYTLVIAHLNYQPRALPGSVSVAAPNTTSVADSALATGGAIAGKVTDPDGQPVAGVLVSVLDAATGKPQESSSYTNAAGEYSTPPTLANGKYVVKFQPPSSDGQCPLAIEYSGNATTATAATRVTISAPTTITGIDAQLAAGGHIAGTLSDAANGQPINGAVWVYDASGALVSNGYGSLGHYRTVAALPAGNYRVQFIADQYVPMFYGGATVIEAAARVPSGASDVDMALTRGGTLTGRISARDTGAPLEHALVSLYGVGDRVVATQLSTFDGSYRFKGALPSGAYRVGVAPGKRADGTPFFTGYQPVFSGGASSLEAAQLISLTAPQTISADLAMPPTSVPSPTPTLRRVYVPLVKR